MGWTSPHQLHHPSWPRPAGGSLGLHGAHQRRMLAKAVDLLIFLALARVAEPLGAALGLWFILVADACWSGQSPGKRLFGVTVMRLPPLQGGGLLTSILRNLPLAVVLLLSLVPLVNLTVFPLMGIPLFLLEGRLTRRGTRGRRLGDVLGDCYVADIWRAPDPPKPAPAAAPPLPAPEAVAPPASGTP